MASAILYARSSKDRSDVSVDSQIRELARAIQAAGDVLVEVFEDRVESAKSDARPAFQAMMQAARSKPRRFSVIYCYDTSRFARSQTDAKAYKYELKKLGIEIRFLMLPKTHSYTDNLMESMMESIDQLHSDKSKADGLRGMRENIMQGYRAGGAAPTGYQLAHTVLGHRDGEPIRKSKLVPDPITAPIVQAYLKGRATGLSRAALRAELPLPLNASTLVYIEQNALTYAGHTVWNRSNERVTTFENGKRRSHYVGGRKLRPVEEWVIERNTHEALITEDEAHTLLNQLQRRSQAVTRQRRSVYLLGSLLQCGCGARMEGNAGYYCCSQSCGARGIKRDTLDQAVLAAVLDKLVTLESLSALRAEIEKQARTAQQTQDSHGQVLQQELKALDKEIRELTGMLTEVKHRRPILERLDQLEEQRQALAQQQPVAQLTTATPIDLSDTALKHYIQEFRHNLAMGSIEHRKALVRTVVEKAVLKNGILHLHPAIEKITGVKMASPRGFEPRLSP